jgi:hypothetical protein
MKNEGRLKKMQATSRDASRSQRQTQKLQVVFYRSCLYRRIPPLGKEVFKCVDDRFKEDEAEQAAKLAREAARLEASRSKLVVAQTKERNGAKLTKAGHVLLYNNERLPSDPRFNRDSAAEVQVLYEKIKSRHANPIPAGQQAESGICISSTSIYIYIMLRYIFSVLIHPPSINSNLLGFLLQFVYMLCCASSFRLDEEGCRTGGGLGLDFK